MSPLRSTSRDQRELEALWDAHGTALYALARTMLGDEASASVAVTLAMTDVARVSDTSASLSPREERRRLARHVYLRSQELAPTHRACLALCVFGAHTYREAAELVGMSPATVADLITSGLRQAGGSAAAP